MKMKSLCAASSQRTGSGEWNPWTAPNCEGLACPILSLDRVSGDSPVSDRASLYFPPQVDSVAP